jgi:hypothetical protein
MTPMFFLCVVVVVTAMSSNRISPKSSTSKLTTTPCAEDWLNVPTTILAKNPEEVERMLKLNREDDRPATLSMLTPHGP